MIDYRDLLKANVSQQSEKLLGGKHIQGKLMSKVVNLLFSETHNSALRTDAEQARKNFASGSDCWSDARY
ncbi:MAG: hypothetical protein V7K46_18835 [Nostoc sp.]